MEKGEVRNMDPLPGRGRTANRLALASRERDRLSFYTIFFRAPAVDFDAGDHAF